MAEKTFTEQETKLEHIPSKEEVKAVFEKLVGQKYETEVQAEDEKGLYLWTIKVKTEGEDGYTEYEYTRKGHYESNSQHGWIRESITSVSVTYYNKDNVPFCGTTKAVFVNGAWEIKL